jgi:1,2-phenylacetyl-CoA epoxidase PaaB subunit
VFSPYVFVGGVVARSAFGRRWEGLSTWWVRAFFLSGFERNVWTRFWARFQDFVQERAYGVIFSVMKYGYLYM